MLPSCLTKRGCNHLGGEEGWEERRGGRRGGVGGEEGWEERRGGRRGGVGGEEGWEERRGGRKAELGTFNYYQELSQKICSHMYTCNQVYVSLFSRRHLIGSFMCTIFEAMTPLSNSWGGEGYAVFFRLVIHFWK